MATDKVSRVFEFKTASGQLLFSISLIEKGDVPTDPSKDQKRTGEENGQEGTKKENKKESGSAANNGMMTGAQKRYLFRLLAEQGKEGEEAHLHLKNLFQIAALKEVTKLEASQAIERLLAEQKGGAGK